MARAVCCVSWCHRVAAGHGMCETHLKRVRKGRAPWEPADQSTFFRHVTEDTATGCWDWDRPDSKTGYGVFRVQCAHRWSYRLLIGEIPEWLHLDHLCRNRRCVNPWHLDPVTTAVNNRRQKASLVTCKHGHEWTESNTYRTPDGRRQCRTCIAIRCERHRRRSTNMRSESLAENR